MKSTVEQLSPTRVKITVEVPFEELKPEFDSAYRSLAQQVRIPGFRPGRAPAKLIEARVGRDAVLSQVVNDAVPARYQAALDQTDVKALGQPEIDLTELAYGETVTFTAEVDVRPEITLPDYADIAVEVDAIAVADEDVQAELDTLRARFGTLKGVDRPIETGDFVSIDLDATIDGTAVPEASTQGLSYEVGSGDLVDGLDDALVGLSSGESATFQTTLVAGEFAGQTADVTVTVGSVKVRELPEADDEFAELASEFDTIDELTADLRTRVERTKRGQQANVVRDKALEALLAAVEFPLPEKVVEEQTESEIHDVLHIFDHDEEKADKFLQDSQDTTLADFRAKARESAEKAVRSQLLLDAIAEAEETSVSQEELTQQILFQAQRYGIPPQEFVSQLQNAGQLGALYADARRGKALASVVTRVTVTDSAGAPVDVAEFFGFADEDSDDES